MEKLAIKEVKRKIPQVNFNNETGIMEIKGMSCSENAISFYRKLLDWVDTIKDNPNKEITLNMKIYYMTTSSAKCVYDLISKFLDLEKSGSHIEVNWYYESGDDDMKSTGEELSEILEKKFNLIEADI